ncbi:hypothetical protein GQ43DRAFT_456712 [Delitschia confertaspora ATCC 74209]|uniref:rRNA-processing protein EFG1 n=1 Tax=Delitschia confertaspora ATCC 74209 TaxID=1513339 RepID=A0A9P4JNI3_9PLEO|nr:hypothetical protein GQ43DRAFT_456712 [Delitschia confertaspora ATCC 74209]
MSHKRNHAEFSGEASESRSSFKKSRANFAPNHPHNRQNRAHKSSKPSFRNEDYSSTKSTNALKSRIRDLRRLLDHANNDPDYKFPANVRIERERELEACEHELAEKRAAAKEAETRKKMIGKYHQVRFFDRQKATRILKKLRRDLASLPQSESPDQTQDALLEKIHNAEVDLNYALFYPLMKPYSSLYPRSKPSKPESSEPDAMDVDAAAAKKEEESGPKGDPEMWRAIAKAMEEGQSSLDALRNWKPEREIVAAPASRPRENKREKKDGAEGRPRVEKEKKPARDEVPKNRRERRAGRDIMSKKEESEEDSDGGFFE